MVEVSLLVDHRLLLEHAKALEARLLQAIERAVLPLFDLVDLSQQGLLVVLVLLLVLVRLPQEGLNPAKLTLRLALFLRAR